MLAKPPHEGVDRQGLVFDRAGVGVIAPAEGDVLPVEAFDPAFADGDAVGVVGQIGKHDSGPAKGRLQ